MGSMGFDASLQRRWEGLTMPQPPDGLQRRHRDDGEFLWLLTLGVLPLLAVLLAWSYLS